MLGRVGVDRHAANGICHALPGVADVRSRYRMLPVSTLVVRVGHEAFPIGGQQHRDRVAWAGIAFEIEDGARRVDGIKLPTT